MIVAPIPNGSSCTLTVVTAVALGGIAGAGLAHATGGSPAHPSGHRVQGGPALLPAGHSWTVTLVTGDVVHVTTTVRGRPPLFNVTTLIGSRDDNAHRSSLPLIVAGRPASPRCLRWCGE